MIEKTKKVYFCEFCNKYYLHKGYCQRHENNCGKRPENNHPCFDCWNLNKTKEIEGPIKTVFHCKKTGKEMYSYKVKDKTFWDEDERCYLETRLIEEGLVRMPNQGECRFYNSFDNPPEPSKDDPWY